MAYLLEGNQYPHTLSERFLKMANTCSLEQTVQEPTRQEKTLYLFLTNRPTLMNRCSTIPGLGDHEAVCVDTPIKANTMKPVKRKIQLWKKTDISELESDCLTFQQEFLSEYSVNTHVNKIWSHIKENLISLMNKHVPAKVATSRYNQPWITTKSKQLTRRKTRSYNQQKGKPKNSQEHQRYVKLKRSVEKECKNAHNNYLKDVVSPDSGNSTKKFWSYVKSKKNDNIGVAPLKDNLGILHTDSHKKANILNKQFSSVFNKNENTNNVPDKGPSSHPVISDIVINQDGAQKLLENLTKGHRPRQHPYSFVERTRHPAGTYIYNPVSGIA